MVIGVRPAYAKSGPRACEKLFEFSELSNNVRELIALSGGLQPDLKNAGTDIARRALLPIAGCLFGSGHPVIAYRWSLDPCQGGGSPERAISARANISPLLTGAAGRIGPTKAIIGPLSPVYTCLAPAYLQGGPKSGFNSSR